MKIIEKFKLLTFCVFCLISIFLRGQGTIYRENYFTLGNSYQCQYYENIKKDTLIISGNNVIWDFSNAAPTNQLDTLQAMDPSTTVFFNDPNMNYNVSNLCLYEPQGMSSSYDDNLYTYFLSCDSSIQFIGRWAYNGAWESWYYHLTDLETYFQFPFSFGDSFQDSFSGTSYDMSGSGLHTFHGTNDVVADGFGTLILPSSNYTNCLRLKSVNNTTDSSSTFGITHFTQITYTWFQLMRNGPILEIQTDTNFYYFKTISYYDNPLVGLNEYKRADDITVYPNPFTNKIFVNFNQPQANKVFLRLKDNIGRDVFTSNMNDFDNSVIKSLNMIDLPNGIYYLEIFVDGIQTTKKLIKINLIN